MYSNDLIVYGYLNLCFKLISILAGALPRWHLNINTIINNSLLHLKLPTETYSMR